MSLVATGDDVAVEGLSGKLLARVREAPELNVCPLCAKRLAIVKATGLCRVCHLDQLIEVREAQLLEAVRERRLTQLRQEKRRMRVCDSCGRAFFPKVGSGAETCRECLK